VDLLVRDAEGQLFAYLPSQGVLPVAFPNTALLAGATAMASYQGSLYLLDAGGNQVWRFDAVQGGFSDAPIGLVTDAEIGQADWLTVDDEIYLATPEGGVLRINAGAEQLFPMSGLDRPLLSAGKPVLVGELVLVPDPANSRIVVFNRDGVFRQQLVSAEFSGLSAIAVDPASGLLYVFAGQKLFSTPLP
jgi:outer membrane protein assembly factor BamB